MSSISIDAIRKTSVTWQPFPFMVVKSFLQPAILEKIFTDFPKIAKPGSFPVSELSYGSAFAELLSDLQGATLTGILAEKLQIDLSNRPIMITARGMCREKDGQIHTDSRTKVVTALLYMNNNWPESVGRLRLLNSPHSLDDMIIEIPPDAGTLLVFLNTDNAWHGHQPFVGQRRSIQINWMTNASVLRHELGRHQLSAKLKKLNPFS